MSQSSWNENYAAGETPWDTGKPASQLVELVSAGRILPARTLEIGCGTGTNALWLAERGFQVEGIDIAPLAIEKANAKLGRRELHCRFRVLDFFSSSLSESSFSFVSDRGRFHVFDEAR